MYQLVPAKWYSLGSYVCSLIMKLNCTANFQYPVPECIAVNFCSRIVPGLYRFWQKFRAVHSQTVADLGGGGGGGGGGGAGPPPSIQLVR